MADKNIEVYGIGNPLIDILAHVTDEDIQALALDKGTMTLIDTERGNNILKHIEKHEKKYACGGSAPNTMITMAALEIKTALAGMVGKDDLGEIYKQRLEEKNVISDLSFSPVDTGSCIVLVTPDYERTMSTRLGACREFGPQNVNHDLVKKARYLYFTGYMWDTDNQKESLLEAIKTAHKAGTKVVFDLADPFVVERHYDDFNRMIKDNVDVLLANREEAKLMLGYDDPEKASRELAKNNVIAAIKNSADGSCIGCTDGECHIVDAYSVEAVDSTGAGDNYAAGFLYGLLKGYNYADAGKLASFVAAQVVRQTGAQFDDEMGNNLRKAILAEEWR